MSSDDSTPAKPATSPQNIAEKNELAPGIVPVSIIPTPTTLSMPSYERSEDQLRSKIQSKMTVATFLGGFTFTALLELIKEDRNFVALAKTNIVLSEAFRQISRGEWPALDQQALPTFWDILMPLGALCLIAALILFVGTVYSYDNLAMPFFRWNQVVWRDKEHRKEKTTISSLSVEVGGSTRSVAASDKRNEITTDEFNGKLLYFLYAFMVRIWSRGFSAGVAFAVLGLFFILLHTGAYIIPILFIILLLLGKIWIRFLVRPRIKLVD